MGDIDVLNKIKSEGICAIMRGVSEEDAVKAAEALVAGGIHTVEVAFNTPEADSIIKRLSREFKGVLEVGAGTVLDTETARTAILCGSSFILSPTLNVDVIRMCQKYNVLAVPGVATPTEMIHAWEAGARLIKVFPAKTYGPEFIRQVKGPLNQLEIMVVGGINIENISDFVKAGACCAGIGSELVSSKLTQAGEFSEITNRAKQFITKFNEAIEDRRLAI